MKLLFNPNHFWLIPRFMLDPMSTYRIQFHKDFTFKDFSTVVPYLYDLGVRTIYASPIYKAVPGSMHGYDVTDPNQINPEIGTLEELRQLSAQLKSYDMLWFQDIVPNHMGFHHQNPWLMDVLKNGEDSPYRQYFDLITANLEKDPLMVPFFGEDLETVIANGELQLIEQRGEKFLKYFDSQWPIRTDLPDSKDLNMLELATHQYYRLCSYKETNSRINYRRFFTVNNLICLNMQRADVFDDYHRLTKSLLEEGIFQGLRIDHVDGLADPAGYLKWLRMLCGEETYIVVEKILEPGEQLPRSWPVQGTTGYDYLGLVNQLFTNQKAERKFDAFYKDVSNSSRPVHLQLLKKKRTFLSQYMQGELDNLYQLLEDLKLNFLEPDNETNHQEDSKQVIKKLIADLLVHLPVYRFYPDSYPLREEESAALQSIFEEMAESGDYGKALPKFRDFVMGIGASERKDDPVLIFLKRLMQFSGPLMAKGVEDTLMYTFNRFIGNNEVGDSPEVFGITTAEFHDQIALRFRYWPYSMNATATHDTKRGEDARTRLAVLTDLRAEWITEVSTWQEMNKGVKSSNSPDGNDEYFIYQTLIATCPETGPDEENYEQRILDYIEKALRESKRNSEWEEPDLDYESRTKDFIQYLLDPARDFWPRFSRFLKKVSAFGKLASLCSMVLKHTLPGIPDTYQGTEFWDLSMVDPDNRRPVDYISRTKLLDHVLKSQVEKGLKGFTDDTTGQVKIQMLNALLRLRKRNPQLLAKGIYVPLKVKGKYATNVIAFGRQYEDEWLIVAVAINFSAIAKSATAFQELDWEDTRIVFPHALRGATATYEDALSGTPIAPEQADWAGEKVLEISSLFKMQPFAIRSVSLALNKRGAGLLLPVSSLPSTYGIGDFGPAATQLLYFLSNSGMKYWQVLPMNPLSGEQAYSPYSSTSVMAGNTLLISPEELAEAGLLSRGELHNYKRKIKRNISYAKVSKLKDELLTLAFQSWKSRASVISEAEFQRFCQKQTHWLEDYVLFVQISRLEQNKPWFQWPGKLKNREPNALNAIRKQHAVQLEALSWQQFVFFRQWHNVKNHANALGIKIIGDLPFYAAHNSADVWTHRKLFSVDTGGQVSGIAGVPPDYFNADGQLWGMPVYNWKTMARQDYKWWTDRISRNLEIYDQLRLDHFRAFSEYWEVPAGSDTASTGVWKPGPGVKLFESLLNNNDRLPLIAEDLGEISQDVYELRDAFGLPGMKVLQFAFGADMASSIHAPHNFESKNCIVYTGTHDNNTTRGWYEQEADQQTRGNMEKYIGVKITRQNAALQMIRLAFSATADVAIVPMQDLLNKSATSRMNTPASIRGNWAWRLKPNELKPGIAEVIRTYLDLYGR
jgi:malto-oligosyltrehalose synthase/4-alpha-glucanotransferase